MTSMSSGADLFVVCKQCGSEVSPYITECPYCGNRLRRRAPKLPRVGEGNIQAPRRQGLAKLLKRTRPAGAGAERRHATRARESRWTHARPYATIALVVGACATYIVARAELRLFLDAPILGNLGGEWWRLLTYPFIYFPSHSGVYALVAIACTGLFGWLVEQRHGPLAVLVIFFGAGVTGALAELAAYPDPIAFGANAGALGLLGAWAVPDLRAVRAGGDYEGDLLGAGVLAALLLAMPFASEGGSWLAGVVGGGIGLIIGQAFDGVSRERSNSDL